MEEDKIIALPDVVIEIAHMITQNLTWILGPSDPSSQVRLCALHIICEDNLYLYLYYINLRPFSKLHMVMFFSYDMWHLEPNQGMS